jgi:ribonuclease T2
MIRRAWRLTPLLLLLGCSPLAEPAVTGGAEGEQCVIPARLTPARAYRPPADEVAADVETAHYLMAVSWSPQACLTGKDYPDAEHQCRDNRFGLILHGLWPNGPTRTRHPRYCAAAPAIRAETVRRHFCMIPSPSLQQHEWAAHGTCGWDTPEAYFDQAARLWDGLKRPDLEAIPARELTAGSIRRAFARANPGLPERAVWVVLAEDGAFREARICYSKAFVWEACPHGAGPRDGTPVRLASRNRATGR